MNQLTEKNPNLIGSINFFKYGIFIFLQKTTRKTCFQASKKLKKKYSQFF